MPLACQADEVRAAVASLSLCSAQTVSTLQRLLSASPNKPLAADESQSKAAGARKAPVKSSRATANRTTTKAAGASTKSGRGAAPISIHTETQDALSPSQKQKLATDVVNSSLKVLTDAIKSQPKTHPRDLKAKIDLLSTSSNAHKPSLGRTPSTQSQESCKSPARPLTELRNSSNPLRRSSSNSSTTNLGPSPAIIAVAECSRIAFSYLRAIASRDTEAKGLPAIQVETGMLALVAKLILHGLDTLAFKELRILKRCLEKHECVETPKPISRGEVPESDKETLATLLRVECRSSSNAVLNLVVLHHTHVLRLLSKSKRVALIESAANYLDFASPFSPTAIILGCAEVSGDTTRAIKQLESLGRSILALAPSAASSADAMSINPKTCISPQIAFRLQTTALDIHKRWWQLANHSPNLEKELLEPTSRYLDAYRRHAMLDTAEKYCFARSKIMPLLSPAPPDSATILQGTSAFSIYRSLSTLAHSASITADAQNFAYLMEKACVNTYASGILGMSCTIRSIMLHIESQAQIHVVRDKLQYCNAFSIKDSNGHVDTLLVELAVLQVRGDIAQQTEALQLLANVYGLQPSTDPSLMLQLLAELGLQYLRIGHSGIADKALQQAEALAKHDDVSALARVQYWLAEVERNVTHRQLDRAQQSATMLSDALKSVKASDPARKSFLQQMRANAALVYSSLNAHLGEYREALLQAKRSVMFNRSAISILEQEFAPPTASPDSAVDIADIVQGVSELTFATKDRSLPSGHQKSQQEFGSMFWGVIPSSMRSYNHLSQMYAQTGLRFEAEYYAQEARKLAGIVKDAEAETRCATIQALHAAAIGEQYSRESAVIDEQFPIDPSLELVEFHTACGDLHARTDSWQAASEAYDTAESLAIRIASKTFNDKIHFLQQAPVDKVGSKFARSSTTGKTLPIKNQPAQRAMKSGKKIVATTRSTITATNKKLTTEDETIPISRLRSIVLRQRSLLLMRQGQLTAATDLLVKAESICPGADDSIMQQIAYARVTMSRAAQVASADFTFNVLPESTISYPSLSTKSRRKSHNEGPRASLLTPPRPSTNGRSTSPKKIGRRKAQSEDFAALLQDAQNRVARLQAGSGQVIGLSTCYQLCALASKASVLLSAIDTGLPRGTLHPTRAALSIELPRIEAVCREISSIGLDKSKDNNRDFVGPVHQANNASPPALSAVQFQRDFIDIIPESWTAVSLGLSEDCNELYVTRYQSRQAPFILRLPLVRNKLQDLDEDPADEFSFHAGKAELQEIVTLTNYSCHRTPDPSIKGAKTAWWAEREALDERLHELLLNIESLWLGGFKGIFSQHLRQSDLLARFRTTFESILDRNLPSRQGAKGRSKSLTLDSNVLELFIGLGDDQHGAIDIDEQILDLLYFVVDVLQFNGERNAYDEVDFDNIATETLDALRSYHEAAMPPTHEDSHLILVLDKRLHAFPWENLPCLSGVNVSRVGSMLSLRERIVAMRRKQCEESTDTFRTTKVSGTYIMNPSSDLVATQATLEPLLSSLQSRAPSGWNAISNKVPTEQDFTGALSESSMLLYFGHGSGNQYVRNRAIRKLDKCSDVVWLMGCSSGAVAENGDYEPTSVPLSYLMAGAQCERSPESDDKGTSMEIIESGRRGLCMAVVATLWDVTDKDIDRFSVRVGEEWGLWSNSAEANALGAGQNVPKTPAKRGRGAPKTPAKTPGRSRSRAANVSHPQGRKKSLVEAVAKGRGACNLRYLNGAATVVYGIPVYLDD
ncbi:hypothetical protein MBLNU459_g4867t1 [Dothideomycetes sp. NU459]